MEIWYLSLLKEGISDTVCMAARSRLCGISEAGKCNELLLCGRGKFPCSQESEVHHSI